MAMTVKVLSISTRMVVMAVMEDVVVQVNLINDLFCCILHVVMLLLGKSSTCARAPFSALFFCLHCADELSFSLACIYVLLM